MATSSAPEFPYPGGTPGAEPPDPVAGKPGHFAWSRWIKEYVKRLNTNLMAHQDAPDPHPQYMTQVEVESIVGSGSGGGVSDHGLLTGLGDDDHPQYLNNARGDVRYQPFGAGGGSTILSGTANPTPTTGDVGDYYLDTDDGILYGPKGTGGGYSGAQMCFTSQVPASAGTMAANYTFGNDIQFAVAGRVTGLRFYRNPSDPATTHNLKAWTTGGTLLATSATAGETSTGWQASTFATPLDVTAGQTIRITQEALSPGYMNRLNAPPVPMPSNGGMTILVSWYQSGLLGFPTGDASDRLYFIDAIFEAGSPSPWPVALKSVPPGGTTGQFLKKTSNADYAVGWVT